MNLFSRERLKKNMKPQELQEGKKIPLWARGYYSMYDGYLITGSKSASGRNVYQYRYAAEVYRSSGSREEARREKISCLLLILLSGLLFTFGAVRFIPANTVWFITFPQAVYVMLFAFSFLAVCRCLAKPEELTRYNYRKGALRLKTFPRSASCVMAAAAVLTAGYQMYRLLRFGERQITGFAVAILYALSAAAMYAVHKMEADRQYKAENRPLLLEKGTQIIRQIGDFSYSCVPKQTGSAEETGFPNR